MKRILSFTICLTILSQLSLSGQKIITELYGFRLGKYRETATNELGFPTVIDRFEDGYEYEVFLVNADETFYVVFEYEVNHTDLIWSIQVTGSDKTKDLGFKNLRFGMEKKEVEKLLGPPDEKEDMGEYGEKWSYNKTNYSVEISIDGLLSSVKILNTYSNETPDLKKLPNFKKIISKLQSGKVTEIAKLIAPGIEIYYKDSVYFFHNSFQTEITSDNSGIFSTIKELTKGLNKVNTKDKDVYEENMRIGISQSSKHVIKIKSGYSVKEIVFDYVNGEYLIWEINAQ